MKKTNIGLLVTAAMVAAVSFGSYASVNYGTDHSGLMHEAGKTDIKATVSLHKVVPTYTGDWKVNPNIKMTAGAQNVGYINVSPLTSDVAYVLGQAEVTGTDINGYSNMPGVGFGWDDSTAFDKTSATNTVAKPATDNETGRVQIIHNANAPEYGVTTITIPVSAYVK